MNRRVYVGLLNWRSWGDTIECLESVFRSSYQEFRVIVCDNASGDGSIERMTAWASGRLDALVPRNAPMRGLSFPPLSKKIPYVTYNRAQAEAGGVPDEGNARLIFIQNGANLGFAAGMNVAIRYALARDDFDYFWLLNNDTVIVPTALAAIVQRMEDQPDAGQCGSTVRLYQPPHDVQCLGGGTFNKWLSRGSMLRRTRGEDACSQRKNVEKRLDFVFGASLMVRKTFLNEVGLLSEDYFMWHEDIDWSLRSVGKFKLTFAPDSVVYHKSGASSDRLDQKYRSFISDRCYQENRLTIASKFNPHVRPFVYFCYLGAILKRAFNGDWDRVAMVIGLMFRGPFGKDGKPLGAVASGNVSVTPAIWLREATSTLRALIPARSSSPPNITRRRVSKKAGGRFDFKTIYVRGIARISIPKKLGLKARRRAQNMFQPFSRMSRVVFKIWQLVPINTDILYQLSTQSIPRLPNFDWPRWLEAVGNDLETKDLIPLCYFPPQMKREKAVVILLSDAEVPLACAKVAVDGHSKCSLANEIKAFAHLEKLSSESFRAPRLLCTGELDRARYLVMSYECGRVSPRTWQPTHTHLWQEFVMKTGQEMKLDDRLWQTLPSIWQSIPQKLDNRFRNRPYRHCAIHGDFAPWNILWDHGQPLLIDWEHFSPIAPYFTDPVHFILSVNLRVHERNAYTCAKALMQLSTALKVPQEDVVLSLAYIAGQKEWPISILHDIAQVILDE